MSTLVSIFACGGSHDAANAATAAPAPAAPAAPPAQPAATPTPENDLPKGVDVPTSEPEPAHAKAPEREHDEPAGPKAQQDPARAEMIAAARRATEELEREQKKKSVPAAPTPAAPPPEPEPAAPAQAPAPAPARPAVKGGGKVTVPSSDHVRVDVPAGLQAFLDADTRMQPWVNRVMSVADKCYASTRADNPGAEGTIEVVVTMHKDDRPDADVKSVPGSLGGMIACATGDLLRTKMPLFTGDEGARFTVKIHFTR